MKFTVTTPMPSFSSRDLGTFDAMTQAVECAQAAQLPCSIFHGLFTVVAHVSSAGFVTPCNVTSGAVHLL